MLEDASAAISRDSVSVHSDRACAAGVRHPARRMVGAEDSLVPVQQSRQAIFGIYPPSWLE
jgi:hypothetical protein